MKINADIIETMNSSASRRKKELGEVEMRRHIEEHMERQRQKALEGDFAELF